MIKKKASGYKFVKPSALNVRSSPSTTGLIVSVLPKGTIVKCDPDYKDKIWDHIIADPNIVGFCMKEFLEDIPAEKNPKLESDIIAIHKPIKEVEDDKENKD